MLGVAKGSWLSLLSRNVLGLGVVMALLRLEGKVELSVPKKKVLSSDLTHRLPCDDGASPITADSLLASLRRSESVAPTCKVADLSRITNRLMLFILRRREGGCEKR